MSISTVTGGTKTPYPGMPVRTRRQLGVAPKRQPAEGDLAKEIRELLRKLAGEKNVSDLMDIDPSQPLRCSLW